MTETTDGNVLHDYTRITYGQHTYLVIRVPLGITVSIFCTKNDHDYKKSLIRYTTNFYALNDLFHKVP